MQIIDGLRRMHGTARRAVAAESHADRAILRYFVRRDVLTLRSCVLQFGRQRNPQLQAMHAREIRGTTVVPHSSTGAHPFDATTRQHATLTGSVLVLDAAS